MSISGISSSTVTSLLDSISTSSVDQMKQAWKDLESALKSGDLTAAKTAFETITKLHAQQVSQSGDTGATSDMDTAMAALGKALDSGDLSAAQSAFANVQTVMKNGPPPPSQSSSSSSTSNEDAVIVELLSALKSSSSTSASSSTSSSSSPSDTLSNLLDLLKGGTLNVSA